MATQAYIAQAPDRNVRMKSSSGGIFSLLAARVINCGGAVYGAAFTNDFGIEHKRVTTLAELAQLRRSKYAYGSFAHTFAQCKADLLDNRDVLFTGLPCQIGALRKYLAGTDCSRLLCVDIICHGAPKELYWHGFLDDFCKCRGFRRSDIALINFRDKRSGWKNYSFTITLRDGREFSVPYIRNAFMRAFLSDYTLRDACFTCRFKGENAKSDITLGDLWGSMEICPEIDDDTGLSVIVPHTPKGEEICRSLNPLRSISSDDVSRYNPALTTSPSPPANLQSFRRRVGTSRRMALAMRLFAAKSLKERLQIRWRYFMRHEV